MCYVAYCTVMYDCTHDIAEQHERRRELGREQDRHQTAESKHPLHHNVISSLIFMLNKSVFSFLRQLTT